MIETAMLMAKDHRLKAIANKGSRGAALALRLRADLDSVIGTILLWNNFANVLIASLATVLAVRLYSDAELILSITSILTTLTILIFAEITPKSIGVRFAESISVFVSRPLAILVRLTPVGKVIRGIIASTKSATPTEPPPRDTIVVDELLALLHDQGTLAEVTPEQKSMLHKLIDLHELSIRDIMQDRTDIDHIDLEEDIDAIYAELIRTKHSYIVLGHDGLDKVVGIVNVRDAVIAHVAGKLDKLQLRTMASKPIFVPDTIDPVKALGQISRQKPGLNLVTDEYGGLIGMVTLSDYTSHLLDTAVTNATAAVSADDLLSGDLSVREVNLRFDLKLNEDNAKTLGGFIVNELGNYPKPGTAVEVDNVKLTVVELDEREITKVKITTIAEKKD